MNDLVKAWRWQPANIQARVAYALVSAIIIGTIVYLLARLVF